MSDDDDFNYTPLFKKKRKINRNDTDGSQDNRSDLPKKTVRAKKGTKKDVTKQDKGERVDNKASRGKQRKKETTTKTPKQRKKYEGQCPNCQMPFSLLLIESPNWHASECFDSYHPTSECPDGADCDCTIPSHYWKYSHQQLARYRSKQKDMGQNSKTKLEFDGKVENGDIGVIDLSSDEDDTANRSTVLGDDTLSTISPCGGTSKTHIASKTENASKVGIGDETSNISKADIGDETYRTPKVDDDEFTYTRSPQDLSEYLDEAFKEATSGSQKSTKTASHDNTCENHGSDLSEMLPEECIETDSCQSLFNDEETVCSSKSVKDIDVSEDSNSQGFKSFFKNYKNRHCINKNLNSDISNDTLDFEKTRNSIDDDDLDHKGDTDTQCNLQNKSVDNGDVENENLNNKVSSDVVIVDFDKAECDAEQTEIVSSSQQSNKSESKTNRTKSRKAANESDSKRIGKQQKSKQNLDSKQMSLFSFFSGSKKTNVVSKPDTCAGQGQTESGHHRENKEQGSQSHVNVSSTVRLKNANDVLMASMKKSVSEPCPESSNATIVKSKSFNLENSKNKFPSQQNRKSGRLTTKEDNPGSSTDVQTTNTSGKPQRACPFYKKIPDTGFTVDAFCYGQVPGCKAYFLSHFHYDHYRGLTKRFSQPIYCSKITGNLLRSRIGVNPMYIHDLPMNTPCAVNGVEVVLLEANHCPGAVLFLFKTDHGKLILHTGDFRADPSMEQIQCIQDVQINQLYLDTTYCDPRYSFPPQGEVIQFGVALVEKALIEKPRTLVVCGSYTIGKERIFTAIARAFDCKICVQRDKFKVLECLEDDDLAKRLTLDFNDSFLHVLPMAKLNVMELDKHLSSLKREFDYVLAIEPTGWTFNDKMISLDQIKPKGNKKIQIYGLPYSEHSSYLEMKRFVQFIKPKQILPTVNNGNPTSRRKMEGIFASWMKDAQQENCKPSNSHQTSISSWTK